MSNDAAHGFGSITWWGFSPAVDIQEVANLENENDYHILVVGAGDLRHTLLTIARKYRHSRRKLHFYLVENNYELLARHMLQFLISLEPEFHFGLQDKTELYLEILGNILVREQTMEYVQNKANLLIRMITDFDHSSSIFPWLKLDSLKFKERDFLEAIFKFWRSKETKDFDGPQCWDLRLRQHLQKRYDAIPNVFDWDYNMKLTERGAEVINGRLYSQWRHYGVAFELRDATYDVTNRTLASGTLSRDSQGNRVARRGYFGDIIISPFLLFGIDSENKKLLEKRNGMHTRNGALISEYNVLAMFYEIANQHQYDPGQEWVDGATNNEKSKQDDNPICTIEEVEEEEQQSEEPEVEKEVKKPPTDQPYEPIQVDDISVSLHPIGAIQDMPKKAKYQKLFTHAYFSNSMVHLLHQEKEGLSKVFADESFLLAESALFMLELKIEQVEMFAEKVTNMAKSFGHQIHGKQDPKKDSLFVFQRK